MIVAINIMLKDKATYFPVLEQKETEQTVPSDLISFSILPNSKVHGVVSYRGVISGGYFFEGNIGINVLDINKNVLRKDHATSITDWMTGGPVDFEGSLDFSNVPKGSAYIEIKQDDPRDEAERGDALVKKVLVPIIVE